MADFRSPEWSAAALIGSSQWGNATTSQLRRCGLSRHQILGAVRRCHIFHVHRGVYSFGRPPSTPFEIAMAAVLAGGRGALLSHTWALWLYGLGRVPTSEPDVTVARSKRPRPGITLHRPRVLPESDANHGIPRPAVASAQHVRAPATARKRGSSRRRSRLLLPATAHGGRSRRVLLSLHEDRLEDDHERRLYLQTPRRNVVAVDYRQVTTQRDRTATRLHAILSRGAR